MNKKHICIMTSVHPWYDTRVYHKEAKALAEAGYKVTMLCRDKTGTDENKIEFLQVAMPKKRMPRILCAAGRMYKEAVKIDADVYIFHDPELLKAGEKLAKAGRSVIYDSHEDVPAQMLTKPYLKPFIAKIASSFMAKREKKICSKLFAVITVEPVLYNRMKGINPNTVMVCNYPILNEFAGMKTDYSKKTNSVCYLGAITKIRGIHEIIDAVEGTDIKLILAGEFETAQLKAECEKQPGYKNVDYRGFLDRQGIVQVLSEAKAGLVTLHPVPMYKDALPVKMFEYMAAEVPVIASDFPYWKGIVDDAECGLTANPMNPDEIRSAIKYIIKNTDVAAEMGQNGRKAVFEKYNWENEKKKFLELFEKA